MLSSTKFGFSLTKFVFSSTKFVLSSTKFVFSSTKFVFYSILFTKNRFIRLTSRLILNLQSSSNRNKLEEEVMKEYKKAEFSEKEKKFYKELWRDLNLDLKDKKKLYVKRSGLYLEVAIELLFDAESGKTLGEIYQIVSE